jgi:uncharacterized membrane protein YwaF
MGVLAFVGTYLFMLLVMLVPIGLVLAGILYLLRNRAASTRAAAFVISTTVLCTPGWGPATIAIVPVPFGLLFGVAAVSFHWGELVDVMRLAPPYWYVVSFPATAAAAYVLWKYLLSNQSSKRTPTGADQP